MDNTKLIKLIKKFNKKLCKKTDEYHSAGTGLNGVIGDYIENSQSDDPLKFEINFMFCLLGGSYMCIDDKLRKEFDIDILNIVKLPEFKMTNKILYEFFDYCVFDIYKPLVEINKIEPCVEHLEHLCYSVSPNETIKFILDETIKFILDRKVIPNNKCIRHVIDSMDDESQKKIDILLLLLEHGGTITIEHVIAMAYDHIVLPNFYKYNLIPTDELFELCITDNLIPTDELFELCITDKFGHVYDYFDNFELSQKQIEDMFLKTNNLEQIKVILKGRKAILNNKCLTNAREIFDNEKVIKYLIEEHGLHD